MKKKAIFRKDLESPTGIIRKLYQLNVPAQDNNGRNRSFVVVSASSRFENETMVFPSDYKGIILNSGEMAGVKELSHEKALKKLGYETA